MILSKKKNAIKKAPVSLTVIVLWILMIAFFAIFAKGFASTKNFFTLLRQISILGIVATGIAPVIITGNIDLSVGAQISCMTVAVAQLVVNFHVNPVIACLIGTVMVMAMSLINGGIIVATGMVAMICTLATNKAFEGIAYTLCGGIPVYGIPDSLRFIGQGYVGPIPVPVIFLTVIFIIGIIFLRKTYIGRYFYAIGNNAEAARLSGISLNMVRMVAFGWCGLMTSIAGIIMLGRVASGQPAAGTGMEMDVITACVVGGISLFGGRGRMEGVVLGALLVGTLSNGLGVMGVTAYNQKIFEGILLVAVVAIDSIQSNRALKEKKMKIIEQRPQTMETSKPN